MHTHALTYTRAHSAHTMHMHVHTCAHMRTHTHGHTQIYPEEARDQEPYIGFPLTKRRVEGIFLQELLQMHTAQYKYTMCRVETDLNRLEPWLCPSSQSNARSDMLYSITLIKISTKLYKSKICKYTSFDKQDLEARKTESKVSPYFIMNIGMFPHSSEFFTVLRWETSTT